MKALRLDAVSHSFGARGVLDDIELALEPGRTLALVGPSGCGKTTLLNLVAGLVTLQEGRIANGFTRSACMFQQPRLLPWRRALANVALGLQAQGVARAERERRATALALRMGLATRPLPDGPRRQAVQVWLGASHHPVELPLQALTPDALAAVAEWRAGQQKDEDWADDLE